MPFIAQQSYKIDLTPHGGYVVVYVSQHDNEAREIVFKIYNQGQVFDIPANIDVSVQGVKFNGGYFTHNCTYSGNIVTMPIAGDMTDVIGKAVCVLKFTNASEEKLATAKFILNVDSDSSSEGIIIDTVAEEIFDQLVDEIRAQAAAININIATLQSMVGSPLVASTVSAMTDHNKIYVYTGDETGYTYGNWYYWSGSDWTSGGVYNSIALETDTTLTLLGRPADAKAVGDKINGIKDDLDNYLLNNYEIREPSNWYNPNAVADGIMKVDGSVTENSDYLYTDYIPVEEGDIIGTFRNGNFAKIYSYRIAAFDVDKSPISTKGRGNKTNSNFTIQGGVAYVRITFEKSSIPSSIKPIIVRDGVTPTTYTAYFEPYKVLGTNMVTEASNTILSNLANKTFNTADMANRYACALPRTKLRMTVGLPEKWYYDTAITPESTKLSISAGLQYATQKDKYIEFLNTSVVTSVNGYMWSWYDMMLTLIDRVVGSAGYGFGRYIIAESLSNCSLLCIGDSTVDHDTMTATIISHFTEKGATCTLLGTLGDGSETNKNEGRAGWKATDYLTDKTYNGVTNPFYNPTTETFDFAYYMQNQGYSGVDFVVLQLGINDLYNYDSTVIESTWAAMETIIDSIFVYSNAIKIILNLPTTPNSDQSAHSVTEFLYRNRVIKYNEYAQAHALSKYGDTKVRCSYCHLILDSGTEIRDNVHPTPAGYQKMALEVVNQINCWQNGY